MWKAWQHVGFRRFVSDPRALCVGPRRSLCRAPALSMSDPGALCVGRQGSLCQTPALHRAQLRAVYNSAYMLGSDCTIEILLKKVGSISRAQQPAQDSDVLLYKRTACTYSAHAFLPILFGICSGIMFASLSVYVYLFVYMYVR